MTNKDAERDIHRDPRMATLLAVHLVSQVLDEAYVIANAAQDSDNPTNVNDHSLIGQGDEEFTGDTDESKSTSLFITNLFDMSDVERDMSLIEPVLMQDKPEPHDDINNNETTTKHDIASYEKAYLTLNRDYEHYSDDEEPVLQDPKGLSMHEIELMAGGSAGDNCPQEKQTKNKELAAISGVSSSGLGSKKSSLIRRCRTQGARLLSCLRGWWWRRRFHGKRRDSRMHGSIRLHCPLSPDARRRAASLLDQRHLRTPSPSRSVVWKFNTVNEALVHSAQWKEFASKIDFSENENS
ncbi:uncharacterized protein LOC119839207 [Zerene cesonia]|uniref:uncharacterized protein LOC119839207 n=1 Tax=Zerene cesonia TaxID=33412 RepID=UPI0018E54A97|nr:uncharacterized protein LOC119839207 [Zerene cesonia]